MTISFSLLKLTYFSINFLPLISFFSFSAQVHSSSVWFVFALVLVFTECQFVLSEANNFFFVSFCFQQYLSQVVLVGYLKQKLFIIGFKDFLVVLNVEALFSLGNTPVVARRFQQSFRNHVLLKKEGCRAHFIRLLIVLVIHSYLRGIDVRCENHDLDGLYNRFLVYIL